MIDLAINRLRQQRPVEVDRFLAEHDVPIVEGRHCTFLYRGEADEVFLVQRIAGFTDRLPSSLPSWSPERRQHRPALDNRVKQIDRQETGRLDQTAPRLPTGQ